MCVSFYTEPVFTYQRSPLEKEKPFEERKKKKKKKKKKRKKGVVGTPRVVVRG
jgi:hypothetical protein